MPGNGARNGRRKRPSSNERGRHGNICERQSSRVKRETSRSFPVLAEKTPRGFPLLRPLDPSAPSIGSAAACPAALTAGTMALTATTPSRVAVTHPDVSELSPAKRPGSSSRKTASHPHRLDLLTLFSDHHSPTAMPDAKQRSMRPAHMSRLAASPLTDSAKPPNRIGEGTEHVKTCYLLRSHAFPHNEAFPRCRS